MMGTIGNMQVIDILLVAIVIIGALAYLLATRGKEDDKHGR